MGRSPCCDENNLKKGPWTPEEDQKLTEYIQKHGHGSWRALPKLAGLKRCGKSCRLRWTNYLRPDIKRGKFSEEEESTILHLHSVLGNKWSAIAAHLPGRTDNEIKNYWNTHLKKRLIQMGIDPITHQPKTDLFSCLPQLIALANLKELLEHTQLTHNLQFFNLLQQPVIAPNNPELNAMNLMPITQESNPYFSNNFQQELGQERVEMSNFFPVENASIGDGGSQPLQQQQQVIPFMNVKTSDIDHEVVGQCQMGQMSDKSASSTWNPLPPLMDSATSSSTVSCGGGSGGGGGGGNSLINWPDFLFEDSFLEENLREIC